MNPRTREVLDEEIKKNHSKAKFITLGNGSEYIDKFWDMIQPGKWCAVFYYPGNVNNREFHVKAIIDDVVLAVATYYPEGKQKNMYKFEDIDDLYSSYVLDKRLSTVSEETQ